MQESPPDKKTSSESSQELHSYKSVESFLAVDTIRDGRHSVEHGSDVTTDLLVLDRQASTTVITFNGAAVKNAPRPYFQTTGMLDSLETQVGPINRVHVHDGLLAHHKDLRIAWYLGSPEIDLSAQLTLILERVLRQLRRGPVVIFGSSAGGFAALTQGEALADTTVVAANPQTVLERYAPSLYREWLEIGGWIEPESPLPTPNVISARTDLRHRFGPYTPEHTYLLLNVNDDLHVNSHAIPWLEDVVGGRAVSVIAGDNWGPDHTPAPRPLLEPFMKKLLESIQHGTVLADAEPLGRLLPSPSLAEVKETFLPVELPSQSLATEVDIRREGVRYAIRDPRPGQAITVSAGLRAQGRPIYKTHLLSVELERGREEYRGAMDGAVWSMDPLIGHFVYLPLTDGHTRLDRTFQPPPDVSIVGLRFCQWVKGTEARVMLTDVNIMATHDHCTGSDGDQGKG